MTSITIQISDTESARIDRLAEDSGLSRDEILRAGVRDLMAGDDEEFREMVCRIIGKNRDLYKKLA